MDQDNIDNKVNELFRNAIEIEDERGAYAAMYSFLGEDQLTRARVALRFENHLYKTKKHLNNGPLELHDRANENEPVVVEIGKEGLATYEENTSLPSIHELPNIVQQESIPELRQNPVYSCSVGATADFMFLTSQAASDFCERLNGYGISDHQLVKLSDSHYWRG